MRLLFSDSFYSIPSSLVLSRINQETRSNDKRNQLCTLMSDPAIEVGLYSDSASNFDSSVFFPFLPNNRAYKTNKI